MAEREANDDESPVDAGTFQVEGVTYRYLVYETPEATDFDCLTDAERDVVDGVLRGWSNTRIGEGRGTSARTVANQLASVYRKLGVSGRGELAHESAGGH